MIEQESGNLLLFEVSFSAILTTGEVDPADQRSKTVESKLSQQDMDATITSLPCRERSYR